MGYTCFSLSCTPLCLVLGMVAYNELRVQREYALATSVEKLLRDIEHNPGVLGHLNLWVPDRYVWRRRHSPLLAIPVDRTNLPEKAPLMRITHVINEIHKNLDIFSCQLRVLEKCLLNIICYKTLKSCNILFNL